METGKYLITWGKLASILLTALFLTGCEASSQVAPPTIEAPPSSDSEDNPLAYLRLADPAASQAFFESNRHLFDYDKSAPLDIEEVSRRVEDGLTIVEITYASPKGGRVPAALIIPGGGGPFAGLVMQRSMELEFGMQYAHYGALVIYVDAPSFRPQPEGAGQRGILTYTEQDREEQIQLIIDLRRAIDLLMARPDVDPDRIAYLGVSYGGAMGGLLAGVEDRLQAYVLIVGDGGLVTHVTNPQLRGMPPAEFHETYSDWINTMWPLEPIHYVSRSSPAPILFQNATRDQYTYFQDAIIYQETAGEPKQVIWYDSTHWPLPDEVVSDNAKWLQQYIGPGELYLLPSPNYLGSAMLLDRLLLAALFLSVVLLIFAAWHFRRRRRRLSPGSINIPEM